MSKTKGEDSPSQMIDARIEELGDWRGETLSKVRGIIRDADPEVVEEWKWVKRHEPRNAGLVARRNHLHR